MAPQPSAIRRHTESSLYDTDDVVNWNENTFTEKTTLDPGEASSNHNSKVTFMGLLLTAASWCGDTLPLHFELLDSNGHENEITPRIRGDAVCWCKGLLWPLAVVMIVRKAGARHNRRARGYRDRTTFNRKRILIFTASCLQVHAAPPEIAGGFNSDDGTDEPGSPVSSIPGGG